MLEYIKILVTFAVRLNLKITKTMKKVTFVSFMLGWLISIPTFSENHLPYLRTVNGYRQLFVDNQPYLMMAGELHNSSTGSSHFMQPIWQRMADKHLNTILAPVSWELIEPEEGHFDFTLLDEMISGAAKAHLKLVILWFGSWKNGASTYAPAWVKTQPKRFPLAQFSDGQRMNTLSTFGQSTMQADAKAFQAMMRHIKETDTQQTVIMVQVENEMGALDSYAAFSGTPNRAMRDYSPQANKSFAAEVPQQLIDYLNQHKRSLHPAIEKAWKQQGYKQRGSWDQVFGKGQPSSGTDQWHDEYPYLTEEIFMAWHYARYVDHIAAAGKQEYALPMFVNAWLKQSGGREPGIYPSGGPLPHMFDIWRAAAPSIDFFAPDIYAIDIFDDVCRSYGSQGNPLFIPETTSDAAGAARCFYAMGKYGAIGYSPFGIDGKGLIAGSDMDPVYVETYKTLTHLSSYIQQYAETKHISGLLINDQKKQDVVSMGKYEIGIIPFSAERAMAVAGIAVTDDPNHPRGGVAGLMVIEVAEGDFIVTGTGDMMICFDAANRNNDHQTGLLSVDEVTFDDNGQMLLHRLNGDETALGGAVIGKGEVKTFRVKLYQY